MIQRANSEHNPVHPVHTVKTETGTKKRTRREQEKTKANSIYRLNVYALVANDLRFISNK